MGGKNLDLNRKIPAQLSNNNDNNDYVQDFPFLCVVCIRERPDLVFNTLPVKSKS